MKFATWIGIPLLLTSLLAPQSFAKEGFSASVDDAPAAVKAVWDRVFALSILRPPETDGRAKAGIDTALYIGQHPDGDQTDLLFLTADHNLEDFCEEGNLCEGLTLSANARLYFAVDAKADWTSWLREELYLWWSKYNFAIEKTKPSFSQVYALKRSESPDLAIIGVRVRLSEAKDFMSPVELETDCGSLKEGDEVYAIGFPMTALRRQAPHRAIDEEGVDTKRWSEGIVVNTNDGVFTTADGLQGISGGPLVGKKGSVISVIGTGVSGPPEKFAYLANEDSGNLRPQTIGVACKFMQQTKRIIEGKAAQP
jgi:hypothetical protein